MPLSFGMEVYTGEIKVDGFREILHRWRPDAIISCVFGQVIDSPIICFPRMGIYNFHPSDLLHGHGAGASPWEDLESRGVSRTVWCVHQTSVEIDAGQVVGQSPEIEVGSADGIIPEQRLLFIERVGAWAGWMACRFVSALVRRYELGLDGPIDRLDLDTPMPEQQRAQMLEPIASSELAETPNRRARMITFFDTAALNVPGWLIPICEHGGRIASN